MGTLLGILFLWAGLGLLAQPVVTTAVGGDWFFRGGGRPALEAPLSESTVAIFDKEGSPIIADSLNCIVGRVEPNGLFTVIAGNGFCRSSGDGGPATLAALASPVGLAYDSKGNLFIAEYDLGYRIRKVTPDGFITTFVSSFATGVFGFEIVADRDDSLYFVDNSGNRVYRISREGVVTVFAGNGSRGVSANNVPATSTPVPGPVAVATDPTTGDVYIGLVFSVHRVRDGIISQVADLGRIFLRSMTVDSQGGLLVGSDAAVYRLSIGGSPNLIAGSGMQGFAGDGGAATSALLGSTGLIPLIQSVSVEKSGAILLGDGPRVRVIDSGGIIRTIAGNSKYRFTPDGEPAGRRTIDSSPNSKGIAIASSGEIYYTEPTRNRISRISAGMGTTLAGDGAGGFSGDGGASRQAKVSFPLGIVSDKAGNLVFSDSGNHRIRRIDQNGLISTFAPVGLPGGLALDASGSLYAQSFRSIVKISPDGRAVSPVAGTGDFGSGGDGGDARLAQFQNPSYLAVAPNGNLFISDSTARRVRMIDSAGIIRTVAGGGTAAVSTVSRTGTSVALSGPSGMVFDRDGNLLIGDRFRILLLSPSGEIRLYAGGASPVDGFPDGKILSRTSFKDVTGLALDSRGALFVFDSDRIRVILPSKPTVAVAPREVSLSANRGGASATANLLVGATLGGAAGALGNLEYLRGPFTGLEFLAAVDAAARGWLTVDSVDSSVATTPRMLTVRANPATLPPDNYTGTVTIVPLGAEESAIRITVKFQVGAALPARVTSDTPNLSFGVPRGAAAQSRIVRLTNSGGEAARFSVAVSTEGNWLRVTPASGTLSGGSGAALTVEANPGGFAAGTYTGKIAVNAGAAGEITIPVTMTVSEQTQGMLLTQTGLGFTAVVKGGVVPPASFGVVNTGTGTLNWTASTSTLSGGTWLRLSTASGASTAGAAAPQVQVRVEPQGLPAGEYYGLVRVTAPGAANTPQVVVVALRVLAEGTPTASIVQPAELVLTAPIGVAPGMGRLTLYNIGNSPKEFRAAGTNIPLDRPQGTLEPANPVEVLVQPVGNLRTRTLTFQFSDGNIQTVRISIVTPEAAQAGTTALREAGGRGADGPTCTPRQLTAGITTLSDSFSVSAGWAVPISVDVRDDCGNAVSTGSVSVRFSNGDPELRLTSLNNGTWQATWPTRRETANKPVELTVTAATPAGVTGTRSIVGGTAAQTEPPIFTAAQVVSAATLESYTALAPGGIISIFGNRLAEFEEKAEAFPLRDSLGDAKVLIGDRPLPMLFARQDQINAVVPFGLVTDTHFQLLVQRGKTYSLPVRVDIAKAQPGVFVVEAYRGQERFTPTTASRARGGDVLVLYSAGLGAPSQTVGDGEPSPAVTTQLAVSATIAGREAPVVYAGLVAGLVGLYQVNLVVPEGLGANEGAPLVLTVAGQRSPAREIPLQ